MAQAVSTLPFRQRMRSGLRVMRGQQIAVSVAIFDDAVKRASTVIYSQPLYGPWGEPPPSEVEAVPSLFRTSEAVKAAVEEFANKVATIPLHLYKQTNTDGDREEVKAHPGLAVLRNPNPFLTRWLLFWNVAADLKLAGNAFWFLAGPKNGQPAEIWRMNPRHTRLVRNQTQFIAGYVTEIDGKLIPLDVNEVIHFKRPNVISEDDLYGLGDLAPAASAAQTGVDMAKWNRGMFAQDYAVPAGVINIENMVSDPDFERLKKEWRESYGSGARRTAFLRGSKVQFQQIGLSQTDVDFLNGAKWEAEKVYRVFGTYHLLPAQFADDRKVNERQFLENHCWPFLTYLSEVLSDQFFGFWGPKDGVGLLTGEFDDIRPRERALDLEEQREQVKVRTFNEVRELDGLDPVDGGDDVLFVHVQAGEKVQFERDAAPEPPPPLLPFTQPAGDQKPSEDKPTSEAAQPEDAQGRAEQRESSGNEVGDKIGESADKTAAHAELGQWQKYLTKRIGTDIRPFKTATIPRWLAERVQAALVECPDAASVKILFDQAHGLLNGKLPAIKSSYGPPDGTVVLYLSGIEDVLLVQQMLQRSMPSDAPFRWTPREQLHITLVHCPIVDEPDYRQISQETSPFAAINVRATQITTFDTPGDAIPIVALVEPTEELRALQADVWADFAVRGIAVSDYSLPDAWQPHITLGYAERPYALAMGLTFDAPYRFGCTADVLAFTRGDYQTIHARMAAPILIQLPAPDESLFSPLKAIQATRLGFEADFESVLAAGRQGDIDRRAWANRTRTMLRRYGEMAYRDGLSEGGITYGPDEPLDPEDRAELNGLLATQSQYVTELGRVLFRTERGVSDGQAAVKPAMWFNKSVLPLYQAGLVSADKNGLYSWSYNPLKQNCLSCLEASKQVHRLKVWNAFNIVPNSSRLICKGFFCGCQLHKTEGRSVGRIDRIPTHDGKAEHEGEDVPMFTDWPSALPENIKAEFNRVLRKQVQACIPADDGSYELTLREAAGYYAGVSEDELQRGLRMIDLRLKLVSFEMVGDIDLRVNFTVEADHASSDTDKS